MDSDEGRNRETQWLIQHPEYREKGKTNAEGQSNENELAAGRREVQRCRLAHACGFGRIQLRCLLTLRSEGPSSNREAWFASLSGWVAAHCASQIRARHSVAGVPN
jgi:hypothetical protein